jgi:mRNA export factor
MSLFGSTAATSAPPSNTTGDISKDVALNQPPDDSVADLAFSPTAEFLAVGSWDKRLRIYEVNEQGQSQGKAEMTFDAAVVSCSWSHVSLRIVEYKASFSLMIFRMAPRSLGPASTKQPESST